MATFINSTNISAIFDAVVDVAQNHASLTFGAGSVKRYEIPQPGEMESVSSPVLVVRSYDLLDWATGCDQTGKQRAPDAIEPVWVFEIFVIYDYSTTTTVGETHAAAAAALVNLILAYTLYPDLENTCDQCEIIPGRDVTGLTYVNIGGTWYRAAKVTLKACETLGVQY